MIQRYAAVRGDAGSVDASERKKVEELAVVAHQEQQRGGRFEKLGPVVGNDVGNVLDDSRAGERSGDLLQPGCPERECFEVANFASEIFLELVRSRLRGLETRNVGEDADAAFYGPVGGQDRCAAAQEIRVALVETTDVELFGLDYFA